MPGLVEQFYRSKLQTKIFILMLVVYIVIIVITTAYSYIYVEDMAIQEKEERENLKESIDAQ